MKSQMKLATALGMVALATSACAGGGVARSLPSSSATARIVSQPSAATVGGVPGSDAIALGQAAPAPYVSGTLRRYQVRGRWYEPREQTDYDEVGMASWYGPGFHGRATASGERFDQHALTAAHKTLPLPALVEVTNLANGRQVVLRVNDRGPFAENRIIDLSQAAAEQLGLRTAGVGEVRVRYIGRAPELGATVGLQRAEASREPVPAAPPQPTPRNQPSGGSYWVQAAALSDPVMAARLAERLGERARVERAEIRGQTLYRVRVGPWADAQAAEQARQAVAARGLPDALLMTSD